MYSRVANFDPELERARMIAMAVRKQQSIDVTDVRDVGPQPGLRAITQIEQKPRAAGLYEEACGTFRAAA